MEGVESTVTLRLQDAEKVRITGAGSKGSGRTDGFEAQRRGAQVIVLILHSIPFRPFHSIPPGVPGMSDYVASKHAAYGFAESCGPNWPMTPRRGD